MEVCGCQSIYFTLKMQPQTQPQTTHFVFVSIKMQPQMQPQTSFKGKNHKKTPVLTFKNSIGVQIL